MTCRAWLCPPESEAMRNERGAPALVMAQGTSGVREQLKHYMPRFTAAGMYVLLFDYRHFGDSDGQPRQLLSIRRQLQDYAAALKFVRKVPGVDPDRVAVWGSSLAGGHVVEVAVRDGHVAAVVSQNPAMDNLATVRSIVEYAGLGHVLRLVGLGIVDVSRSLVGMSPKLVAAGAAPGELGMMTTQDTLPGLKRLEGRGWRNELCARISLTVGLHRPGLKAHRLPCPILIGICDKDSVAVPAAAEATARRAGKCATVKHYPIGHFDIYLGEWFERAVADQVDFLRDTLAQNRMYEVRRGAGSRAIA
ncbi:MAG TPA: alpha/beta fold hydrolase [Candidatus Acidoferrum sp.]